MLSSIRKSGAMCERVSVCSVNFVRLCYIIVDVFLLVLMLVLMLVLLFVSVLLAYAIQHFPCKAFFVSLCRCFLCRLASPPVSCSAQAVCGLLLCTIRCDSSCFVCFDSTQNTLLCYTIHAIISQLISVGCR